MKKLIDKIKYQAIKKFTYEQMQNFLVSIYTSGYEDAVKEIAPSITMIDVNEAEKQIQELLRKEYGIGEKRYYSASMPSKIKNILKTLMKVSEVEVKITQKEK